MVIPTNEKLMIVRETMDLLRRFNSLDRLLDKRPGETYNKS